MTDRELLKLAAKAAGIEHGLDRLDCGVSLTLPDGRHGHLPKWNPLTDDGDALRLAVKLGIDLGFHQQQMQITAFEPWPNESFHVEDVEDHAHIEGLCAATRRAIVRAAAAIGEMK